MSWRSFFFRFRPSRAWWPWLAGSVLVILLLARLVPYYPPVPSLGSDPTGQSFSPQFADFLRVAFERGPSPTLKERLGVFEVNYAILPQSASIELCGPGNLRRHIQVVKARGRGEDLGYARAILPESLSLEETADILAALENPHEALVTMGERAREQTLPPWRHPNLEADRYVHWVMLTLALTLLGLVILGLRGRLSRRDWPLAVVLALGFVNVLVLTEPAISDIKLHFFNELRQIWRWDIYGPGNPAWQKLLYRFFGTSDRVLFTANSIMGILCAVPLYALLRDRYTGRVAALAGAFLLVTHPIWLRYAAGDIVHAWAFFFFLSSAAILATPERSSSPAVFLALVSLALSMLARGELMALGPALLFVLGSGVLRELVVRRTRGMVYGTLAALALLLPQVVHLLARMRLSASEFITLDLPSTLMTWLWLPFFKGHNTYADLTWSPWPHIVLAPLGVAVLLRKRWAAAAALLLTPPLFLWNHFIFNANFTATHYQIAALPFYILFAGIGGGALLEWLRPGLGRVGSCALGAGFVLGLWLIAVWGYRDLLSAPFTFQQHYRQLAANREMIDPRCTLLYYKAQADHDLHNPKMVWFSLPEGFRRYQDLGTKPEAAMSHCHYYLRSPSCHVMNRSGIGRPEAYYTYCREMESRMRLETVHAALIPARAALGERYLTNPVEVGLYRVTHWRGRPLGTAPENEASPEND